MNRIITLTDLKNNLDKKRPVLLIDALPEKYFHDGHLPGAINVPLNSTDNKIRALLANFASSDRQFVTYCTGVTCPNSHKLAERLAQLGYGDVKIFEAGKEAWVKADFNLEKSMSEEAK